MVNLELKAKFHHLIDEVEDDKILEEAYYFLKTANTLTSKKDIIDELTENQQVRIIDSLQQMKDGNIITQEELSLKIQKWLTK
jgi:hypothetical protein